MRELSGHHGAVLGLTFLCRGHALASHGSDGTIRLWDTLSGETLAVLHQITAPGRTQDPTAKVRALIGAPDGSSLAALIHDRRVELRVWTDLDRDPIHTLEPRIFQTSAHGLDLCLDARTAITFQDQNPPQLVWFDALDEDAAARRDLQGACLLPTAKPERLIVGPDGRRLAVRIRGTTQPGAVHLLELTWDDGRLRAIEPLGQVKLPTEEGRRAVRQSERFLGPETLLFLDDGWAKHWILDAQLWRLDLGAVEPVWHQQARLDGLTGRITAVDLAPDGSLLALGTHDGTLRMARLRSGPLDPGYDVGVGTIHAIRFAPDGLTLAVAGEGGLILLDVDPFC